jgi:hypothetical protein
MNIEQKNSNKWSERGRQYEHNRESAVGVSANLFMDDGWILMLKKDAFSDELQLLRKPLLHCLFDNQCSMFFAFLISRRSNQERKNHKKHEMQKKRCGTKPYLKPEQHCQNNKARKEANEKKISIQKKEEMKPNEDQFCAESFLIRIIRQNRFLWRGKVALKYFSILASL